LPIQANSCKLEGYTIGFFNGVATTLKQAINGKDKLQSTLNVDQYNGQDIDYQLFYNDSYIDESMLNVLGDFAETFDQRTSELEQRTFERWEAFWDIINGRTNSSIINLIDSLISGFLDFFHDVISLGLNEDIKLFLEDLATLSSSTPNPISIENKEHTYTINQCHNLTDSSYLISFASKLSDQTRSPVKYQLRITDRFNMLHEDIEKGQSSDGHNSGNHASFWRIEQSSRVLSDSERKYLTNNNLVIPKSLWARFYAYNDTGL
jgi:hypothetical protein